MKKSKSKMQTNKKVLKFLEGLEGVENESLNFESSFDPENDMKGYFHSGGLSNAFTEEIDKAMAQAIVFAFNELYFHLDVKDGEIFLLGFLGDGKPILKIPLTEIVAGLRECDEEEGTKDWFDGERREMVKIFTKVVMPEPDDPPLKGDSE
jgi:hypothetical protein